MLCNREWLEAEYPDAPPYSGHRYDPAPIALIPREDLDAIEASHKLSRVQKDDLIQARREELGVSARLRDAGLTRPISLAPTLTPQGFCRDIVCPKPEGALPEARNGSEREFVVNGRAPQPPVKKTGNKFRSEPAALHANLATIVEENPIAQAWIKNVHIDQDGDIFGNSTRVKIDFQLDRFIGSPNNAHTQHAIQHQLQSAAQDIISQGVVTGAVGGTGALDSMALITINNSTLSTATTAGSSFSVGRDATASSMDNWFEMGTDTTSNWLPQTLRTASETWTVDINLHGDVITGYAGGRLSAPRVVSFREGFRDVNETPDVRAAREARWQLQQEAAAERQKNWVAERKAANMRAEGLLRQYLNAEQAAMFEKHQAFYVTSQSGQLYRLRKKRQINIDHVDRKTGKVLQTLCAHPLASVPDCDTLLSQKLMLELNEAEFVKLARKWKPHVPVIPAEERLMLVA